jgi:hypothetical protein
MAARDSILESVKALSASPGTFVPDQSVSSIEQDEPVPGRICNPKREGGATKRIGRRRLLLLK